MCVCVCACVWEDLLSNAHSRLCSKLRVALSLPPPRCSNQVTELEKRIEHLQRDVQQKTLQMDNLGASQEKYKRQEQETKRQVRMQHRAR